MPATTPCPILEVDRALSSCINSREETLKIRRTLLKYLTASLRPVSVETKSQHLSHESPHGISAVSTNPPGLKGFRLDYLLALRARHQAQAKHRKLQAALKDMQQRHIDENPPQSQADYDNGSTQGYVTLLRQRRRQAELQVVQGSLEKLLLARPSHSPQDLRTLVEESIGQQSSLPAERLDQLSQAQDDQTYLFKLKQEVLDARSSLDRAKAARTDAQAKSHQLPRLQQQVFALECARDEIVEWVQLELAKMEEDSVFLEDASPIKRPVNDAKQFNMESAEERVRNAYDEYMKARARLVQNYTNLQQSPVMPEDEQRAAQNDGPKELPANAQQQMTIAKLLPHFPHLTQVANAERSLLQQSVYLQNQISSADQIIEEALLRLSGESHLLPAGSKDVAAWGKTAMDAEVSTNEFAKQRLGASHQEISNVSTIVELCSLQSKVLSSS
ncbi:hypothetical protein EK21DRAFT_53648 [Setomelanomma holmii]|uniref:Uncharacterized protein n=1 Tax=Setomelanomma holmii TaxID=210430 RepID=A0A9P4HMH5_9PLEO|nr:hypothetical protein EK21DRAFT_53648 [Setomelanomma holmii]